MTTTPDFIESGEHARLIPVVADTNREQRTASIVLAALRGVYEFRQTMLGSLGVRVGKRAELSAWTEVTFKHDPHSKNGKAPNKHERPDGLLVLDTGRKRWTALVEAKVGNAEIGESQLTDYIKQAKANNVDAVITITNQFVALPSHHPVKLPKNVTRGVELFHWSWMYVLTQATLLLEDDAIASEDQRFILEEVVRHLSHDSSGISRFDSMNREWKDVVGRVKSGATLARTSEEVENTVSSWHQEQRDLCLIMSRRLYRPVKLKLSRQHRTDAPGRLHDDCEELAKNRTLSCILEIPHAAADLHVTADLTTRTIVSSMRLTAPKDKKSTKARANWLGRQLSKARPEDIYIKAIRPGRAEDTQAPLSEVLNDARVLESSGTNVAPVAFEVFHMLDLAGKFSGSKVFIERLEDAVPYFYEQVGQRLRAWVEPPPKIRQRDPVEDAERSANEGTVESNEIRAK